MARSPQGMHFTYFPGPKRILLTPIGQETGWEEPLDTFLDGVDPSDVAPLMAIFGGNGVQTLSFKMAASDIGCTLFAQGFSEYVDGQAIVSGVILERREESATLDQFIQATNASPHTIFLLDFETGRHFWSDAFRERYGHRPIYGPEAVAQWLDLVHPDDKDRVQRSHSGARNGGAAQWQDEYRLRRADGSYAVVIDRASFFRRADGVISRSISSLEDVTELRAREADLRRLTATPAPMRYDWNLADKTIALSFELQIRLGLDTLTMPGDMSSRLSLVVLEDRDMVRAELEGVLQGQQDSAEFRYHLAVPSGRFLAVVDRASVVRGPEGNVIRLIATIEEEASSTSADSRMHALVDAISSTIQSQGLGSDPALRQKMAELRDALASALDAAL